jgi:hypothetical protein
LLATEHPTTLGPTLCGTSENSVNANFAEFLFYELR